MFRVWPEERQGDARTPSLIYLIWQTSYYKNEENKILVSSCLLTNNEPKHKQSVVKAHNNCSDLRADLIVGFGKGLEMQTNNLASIVIEVTNRRQQINQGYERVGVWKCGVAFSTLKRINRPILTPENDLKMPENSSVYHDIWTSDE